MTTIFTGRTALVTGAGRGIGRAIAVELARRGARVALLARSADQLDETAALIREHGAEAYVLPADLGTEPAPSRAARRVLDDFGPVDILVNNAAVVWPLGPSVSVDPAVWAHSLTVNVTAAVALTFALLPDQLRQGWGRVVNVSSGVVARPGSMVGGNAYVTAKTALEAHTVNLAAEVDGTGVTVNVFRPGSVDTGMQAWIRDQEPTAIGPALHERFTRSYADGALITPERSAAALIDRLPGDGNGQIWDVVPMAGADRRRRP
jgi:NAD(P)-dependent dehydrogenase (short-subunit alcohol dehydrogenase family)